MLTRSLTMLCLSLMRVSGWQMAALPVPHGHAQCASSQTSARQAVAPQMCSYDRLSSEFQACATHHPTPRRSSPPPLSSALFRRRRGWRTSARARCSASLVPCCGSTRQTARGCCSSTLASGTRACTLKPVACRMPTRAQSKPTHSAHWVGLGRYTLQGRETPEKSHGTYVLAFEQHEEACRFGMMLQVSSPEPQLCPSCLGASRPPASNPRCDVTGTGARVRPGDRDEVDVGAAG